MTERNFQTEEKIRADVFVSEATGLTRSHVKKLFDEGAVTVGGVPVKAGQTLKEGTELTVRIPDLKPIAAEAEDIPLDIVFEDEDFAVINKPQGMVVHAGAGHETGTLVNACLFHLHSLSGIGGELRPGIVHRLDKDTSGLIVVAKNDAAHLSLSEQIKEKTCRREYVALVEGVIKEEGGLIDQPLGRAENDRMKYAVVKGGREAQTEYFVEERFRQNTLVRFLLRTGRTHQIRVHTQYLGYPIVGDKTYGYKKQRFSLEGQLLHARRIELDHPRTGERMCFSAEIPMHFRRILDIVRKEK